MSALLLVLCKIRYRETAAPVQPMAQENRSTGIWRGKRQRSRGGKARGKMPMKFLFSCVFSVIPFTNQRTDLDNVGRPTRGHSCDTHWRIHPRPPTRPARQVGVLSREDLRTAHHGRQGVAARIPPFVDAHRPERVHAGELGHTDQLALVSEHVRLSDVHHARHAAAAVGRPIQFQDIHTASDGPARSGRASHDVWRRGERFAPSVVD